MRKKSSHKKIPIVRSLIIFCVIPFALVAHIVIGLLAGSQHKWPLIESFFILASLVVLLRMWINNRLLFGWLGFLNVSGWGLAAVFLWWTQIYSSYPEEHPNLRIGDYLTNVPIDLAKKEIYPEFPLSAGNNEKSFPGLSVIPETRHKDLSLGDHGNAQDLLNDNDTSLDLEDPIRNSLSFRERESTLPSSRKATLFVFLRGWW